MHGRRAAERATGNRLQKERRLLLDPCVDDPEPELFFRSNGLIAGSTERAELTIELLRLNRPGLVRARRPIRRMVLDVLGDVASAPSVDGAAQFLQKLLDAATRFSGTARFWARDAGLKFSVGARGRSKSTCASPRSAVRGPGRQGSRKRRLAAVRLPSTREGSRKDRGRSASIQLVATGRALELPEHPPSIA